MSITYPASLALAIRPTPLVPLKRFSEKLGGPLIWLKRDDLTGAVHSGNKVRKLEFALAEALNQGCDTIITCGGLQSNHCRATAVMCAQLGLDCHLILREEGKGSVTSEQLTGNTLLDSICGANIEFFTKSEYQANLDDLLVDTFKRLKVEGRSPWIIPTGASDGIGIWGYIRCAEELKADFAAHNIEPHYICHATGSGGTQAGLTLGAFLHDLSTKVVGINVCDDESYFMTKVSADISDCIERYQLPVRLDDLTICVQDGYVGKGYAITDQCVFDLMHQVACLEGVVFDPVYTGKAFYGLCEEISHGHYCDSTDIVFVHTGGIFGNYAYLDQWSRSLDKPGVAS